MAVATSFRLSPLSSSACANPSGARVAGFAKTPAGAASRDARSDASRGVCAGTGRRPCRPGAPSPGPPGPKGLSGLRELAILLERGGNPRLVINVMSGNLSCAYRASTLPTPGEAAGGRFGWKPRHRLGKGTNPVCGRRRLCVPGAHTAQGCRVLRAAFMPVAAVSRACSSWRGVRGRCAPQPQTGPSLRPIERLISHHDDLPAHAARCR